MTTPKIKVPAVDPALLTLCTDDLSKIDGRDIKNVPFAEVMAHVVLRQVSGDAALALAVLQRITALVRHMAEDPQIVAMFMGDNPALIPRPLTHAAAVAPLLERGAFGAAALRKAAMMASEIRGQA